MQLSAQYLEDFVQCTRKSCAVHKFEPTPKNEAIKTNLQILKKEAIKTNLQILKFVHFNTIF